MQLPQILRAYVTHERGFSSCGGYGLLTVLKRIGYPLTTAAPGIRKDIQRPASEGCGRIARKAAELAVRAVAVKRSTSGECHAAIILLDDFIALNSTYTFHFIIAFCFLCQRVPKSLRNHGYGEVLNTRIPPFVYYPIG
jgi:hypothetical protein